MKTLFGKYIVLFTALLIMAGCKDIFPPPDTAGNSEKGTLVLSIGKGAGRTIMPSAWTDNFDRFELEFTAMTAGNSSFRLEWTTAVGMVDLDAGIWKLTISAYFDDGENSVKAAHKTETITVVSGKYVVYPIILEPVVSGTGTFSWTITYPAGVTGASMVIIPDTGNPPQTHLIERGVAASLTLGAGQYRVVFTLIKGEQEAVFSEVLHVYQNMESEYTKTFTNSIFPVGLLRTISEVIEYLEAATGGATVDDPVYLPVELELGSVQSSPGSSSWSQTLNWQDLTASVNTAKKYVELDLFACGLGGINGGTGDFPPPGSFSVNTNYMVSLVLPRAAKNLPSSSLSLPSLQSVSGENIVTVSSSNIFNSRASLTSADFPAVTGIVSSAFSGFTKLTSVNMPAAGSIGDSAFSGCTSLTSVDFPVATSVGSNAFSGAEGLTSVNIPLAASVGVSAFSGCTSLTSVNISLAASIGNNAFENTGTHDLIVALGSTAPVLGTTIFSDVTRTVRVQTPRGAEGYVENWVIGLRGRGLDVSGGFSDTTVREHIGVSLPWVTLIFTPDDPLFLRIGGAVSLAAPGLILAEGVSIAGQGWQISDNGVSGWANFIPPSKVGINLNEKFMRYYIATNDGVIAYSNAATVSVLSDYYREVTVRMWDRGGNGWDSAALKVYVNGNHLKTVSLSIRSGQGSDTFMAKTGDTVSFSWVKGTYDYECAFAVYYSDDPPSPTSMFDPSTGANTSKIVLSKRYGDLSGVVNGSVLGSFIVGVIGGGGVFIDPPFFHEGKAFTLPEGLTGQNWQISDNGSTWTSFIPPPTAGRDLNGKYLRYFDVAGEIISNVVTISIIPVNPQFTVQMWDSYGDGWGGGAALRVNINGTETNIRLNGSSDTRVFNVQTGDAVGFYWVDGGSRDWECAFAVYYTEAPPSPMFDPSMGTTDTTRVLLSKKYDNPSGAVGNGTLMGWFTVGHGVFINTLYAPSAPMTGAAFPLPAVPGIITDGVSIAAQGWQISSADGSTWSNFTPPATVNKSNHHGRKLRYYVTSDEGKTYYSNAVTIMVRSTRQVTVAMYSKNLLGGWGGSAALRITVNGANYSTVKPDILSKTDVYRFNVVSDDKVAFYWVNGGILTDYNCGFVVYYTDVNPDPWYNSDSGSWYSLGNALLFLQFRTIGSAIGNGTLMGSFTVPY
jgi:hypothetical protein